MPHNEYLHLLVNGGAVGLPLCLAAIAYWYHWLIRSAAEEDRSFLIALVPAWAAFAVTENVLIHACALALYVYLSLVGQPQPSSAMRSKSVGPALDSAYRRARAAVGRGGSA